MEPWLLWGVFPGGCLIMSWVLFGPVYVNCWHNQQRVGQILLFAMVTTGVLLMVRKPGSHTVVPLPAQIGLGLLLLLGIASASRAVYPLWGLMEISLYVGCISTGWLVAAIRRRADKRTFDRCVLGLIFFLCAAKMAQFLVAYSSLLTFETSVLDPKVLLTGFSNLRFYGHWLTLSLPLLAIPILTPNFPIKWKITYFAAMAIWWGIAITTGTRGTWLALGMTGIFFTIALGSIGRKWALIQLAGAGAGCLLFLLWMTWIPMWANIEVQAHAADRLTTAVSGRDQMLAYALEFVGQHPWLGVGPMHYALRESPTWAHPHQTIMLWASEWGIPAAIIFVLLLLYVGIHTVQFLHRPVHQPSFETTLRLCLAASLCAITVHGMVSGVTVMPNTQIWISILGGWLFALCGESQRAHTPYKKHAPRFWVTVMLSSTMLLVASTSSQLARLEEVYEQYRVTYPDERYYHPRYWGQGMINVFYFREQFNRIPGGDPQADALQNVLKATLYGRRLRRAGYETTHPEAVATMTEIG